MNVTLLTGTEALECVESAAFQSAWKALSQRCPWAGACQHPDFVAPWYRLYRSQFLPVLVFHRTEDGALDGLLTLGLGQQGRALTGAGAHQAEYQAWITPPDAGKAFILAALGEIRAAFPGTDIFLRYLPAGLALDWIDQGPYRKLCAVRSHRRPLMRIDEAAMARQRNKKNNRQNFNRLSRMGEVRFERVLDHGRFLQVFDEICMQYDFRQAALYRQMPFSGDPLKKSLYTEMHKRGLLHASILSVGQEIAASHVGPVSQGRALHLGILTHGPAYAAHSPGNLLLAMLGVELAKEGLPVLDLTPGGDGYKEHFASGHDTVFELTIYGARHRLLGTEAVLDIRQRSKTALHKAGVRPADLLAALDSLRSLRVPGFRKLPAAAPVRPDARACTLRYRRGAPAPAGAAPAAAGAVSRNRLADVFKFDPHASSMSRWEFFGEVMKRMERSQHLYSLVQDDRLALFCWAGQLPGDGAAPPDKAILLSDLYVHHKLQAGGLVQHFIEQVLLDVREADAGAVVYYRGDLDRELEIILRRCGFIDAATEEVAA